MNIVIAYICVAGGGQKTHEYAARFVGTYLEFSPGIEHRLFIVCNGGLPQNETQMLFLPLNCTLYPRKKDNGWDITAYQDVAKNVPCDLLICLGESVYFHRAGWGKRLVEETDRFGKGMYGPFATNVIRAHLQTTAFCCPPELLLQYPLPVTNRQSRYEFEHGRRAFWRELDRRCLPVRMVTWDGAYPPHFWRSPKNILWRGDQSNLLMWSNHSDAYRNANPERKRNWERSADRPFQ